MHLYLAIIAAVVLGGCQADPESWLDWLGPLPVQDVTLELHPITREVLPLAPHVRQVNARPTLDMAGTSQGMSMLFTVLDKRTLKVFNLAAQVGERVGGPWKGWLEPGAFVPNLQILEGKAIHGPEGHVNPAAWVTVAGPDGGILHEGWLFQRDPAQTAWDHVRYDITFMGMADPDQAGGGGDDLRSAPVR